MVRRPSFQGYCDHGIYKDDVCHFCYLRDEDEAGLGRELGIAIMLQAAFDAGFSLGCQARGVAGRWVRV